MLFRSAFNSFSQNENKILITYFSWSGNTKQVADYIKESTGGELYEIKTVKPYSSDYSKCVDEAKAEKESGARPEIQGKIDNLSDYDVIFVGYPNWWGTMPMPILTFLESHDFKGKTLVPFCTHGGGGVQQCFKDFSKYTSDYNTKPGLLLNGSNVANSKPQVEKWLKEKVGINK